MKSITEIILYHYERWDGFGYPTGLKEELIPMGARIIAICDSIDAMTSVRPYRDPFSWESCKEEIYNNAGTQFDPFIVDQIGTLWDTWMKKYL